MPRLPIQKKLPIPAVCWLLLWFCATACHAGQGLPVQPAQPGQSVLKASQAGNGQSGATLESVNGFYLAHRFLCQRQNHIDRMTIAVNGVSASDGIFHSNGTAGAALAIGYDLWPGYKWPLRAELELALRGNSHYSKKSGHQGGRQSESYKSLYNATTFLASIYYDYHNETSFVPYMMAGAGLAYVYGDFVYRARVASEEFKASGSRSFTNFAWAVGSGLAWKAGERLTIDLGYRYLDLGRIEFSGRSRFGPAMVSYQAGNLSHLHEISLGLRFYF